MPAKRNKIVYSLVTVTILLWGMLLLFETYLKQFPIFSNKFIVYFSSVVGVYNFDWYLIGWNLVLIIIALFIDLIFNGYAKSVFQKLFVKPGGQTVIIDFYYWLVSALNLAKAVSFVFTLGLAFYITEWLDLHFRFSLLSTFNNVYAQTFVLILCSDFKNYLRHFLSHKWNWYWNIHKLHHSATEMTLFTNYRHHFMEYAIMPFFDVALLIVLGAPFESFFIVGALMELHSILVHSNLNHKWGWVGKWVLVSPFAHRVHHSADSAHYNKNFGGFLIIWDRIFGTYLDCDKVPLIGLNEEFNRDIVSDSVKCLKDEFLIK